MSLYTCWDESGCEINVEAATAEEAAQEYVGSGDWSPELQTYWINVNVADADGDVETVKVSVHPEDPTSEKDGEWVYQGCQGSGGGVKTFYERGGWQKTVDSWGQDMQDGVQGLEAISYKRVEVWED